MKERLIQLRKEKGVTLKEVANNIGVTVSAYSNYEQGIRMPSVDIICRICKYFDVTSDYLLGLENIDGTKINIVNSFNNSKNISIK